MLYVFHVETGTMMTFDMNLAMESVSSLQSVIARGCRISEDKQVLLVSGGESLDPVATVGKYHAGTDTNPIFLFSKSTIEAATPPSPSVNYGSDIDLQGQVEGSLLMPPAYQTVVSRAQLALQFQDVDSDELRACERLIHDQHLQQQGWAAVVANLEDVTSDLKNRFENFQEAYVQYLENRESYRNTLKKVSESLQLLAKIPVLPCLHPATDQEPVGASGGDKENYSLFDWISSQDANHSLHDMVEQCVKATEQLDQHVGESLRTEVDQMFKDVHNASMKEVKGLEDRLYGLDQIISGARKIVTQQSDLAQLPEVPEYAKMQFHRMTLLDFLGKIAWGFVHNQNRLSNIRDMSILPDLCSSHRNQLLEMLKNHTKLREIKKKCRMAKEELSVNLHTRLRWVMYVEKKICDVDGKLTIYLGNLKRLSKRLDILQQVHDAPKVYAQFVIEVVRRRQFSHKFLMWATSLAEDSGQLQTDELRRREAFILEIGRHFLQSLFQGLEDYPPPFAKYHQSGNSFDPDQVLCFIWPDLVPNYLQKLSADSTSSPRMWRWSVRSAMCAVSMLPRREPTDVDGAPASTEAPRVFDENLPEITSEDISELKDTVPELSDVLKVPDDEDLFHILSSMSIQTDLAGQAGNQADHSLQVPAHSNHSIVTLQPRSTAGSETEVLYGDHTQFKSIEVGSISLGDQFTECNQEPEIVVQPDLGIMSPTDKEEFLLPQSLSEALTMEMKLTERRKSGEFSPKLVGSPKNLELQQTPSHAQQSSVSALRETQSRRGRLPSVKSPLGQSPELETSLEFTTADFYIDESMPSSMDSPPKTTCSTDSKSLASDNSKLESDKVLREKYETEMKEYRIKLTRAENLAKALHRLLTEKMPLLVSSTSELKAHQMEISDVIKSDIDVFKDTSMAVIASFCSNVETDHQQVIDRLQSDKEETEMLLKDEIESEQAKNAEMRNEIEISKKQFEDMKNELEGKIEELQKNQSDLAEKHNLEIKELIQNHELEMEVEIDKVKAELGDKHVELEKELEKSVVVVQDKVTAIESLKKDKVKLEETLVGKFQREKEEICDILAKEYDEKLDKAMKLETEKLNNEKSMLKEELNKLHESETERKLEELKQSLLIEKQEAVDLTQSTLTLEHNKLAENLKSQILEDKTAETDKIKMDLELKFQEDLAKFNTEFNKEKQVLLDELNSYKFRVFSDCDAQTELDIANCDTQTGHSLVIDHLSNSSMQTNVINQLDISNQTDALDVSSFAVQTDELHSIVTPILASSSMQTEPDRTMDANSLHLSTQTDTISLEQCSTQTDKSGENQSETQTESEAVNHSSSQTDIFSQDQTAAQTEQMLCDQSNSQTGLLKQQGECVDGAKSLPDLHTETSDKVISMQEYEKAIADLEERHRQEISDLIAKLEKEKEDSLQLRSSLTSLTGEKQVLFNEAVNKVVQAKDKVIDELRKKEQEMDEEVKVTKELAERMKDEKLKAEDIKDRALSLLQDKEREFTANQRRWESELALGQQQLTQYKEQLEIMSGSSTPSVLQISDPEDPSLQLRIKELEDVVKLKDESMSKMQQQLMEMSMSTSTRSLVQDKVSIMSCHVGDLVLLCLDERLDHYVVFTVGTTLHFLHTDCLTALGLKSNPGETRKQWSIAEVTDKEYCQAKKPNNRFKVPVGTKFYRVKAKPWTRDSSVSGATASKPADTASGSS